MKPIYKAILTIAAVIGLYGCSSYEYGQDMMEPDSGRITFLIDAESDLGVNINSRGSGNAGQLTRLWYAIADGQGKVLNPHYQKLEPDLSKLTIEGLGHGDYTIAFLATPGQSDDGVLEPSELGGAWLDNREESSPIDGIYYYKKVSFSIGKEQAPVLHRVLLEPCVGKVEVDIDVTSDYMWRFIKSVHITFDDDVAVPTVLHADGTYSGSGHIRSYDITDTHSLYSFPSGTAMSGFVEIESERNGGETFSYRYRFTDCRIEAGRISHIRIDYRHPESDNGMVYVREDEYWRFGTDTMFMADEPREVFYNADLRSFRVNAPLQLSITGDHKLGVRFFSPIAIKNVTVRARFNKASSEFVDLAHFDAVYPFMEGTFPLPVVERDVIFTTDGGRKIKIPACPDLSADDITMEIVTDDPFMQKIARIDSRWYIRFSSYSADNGHAYWRHMNPLLCRHGVALALNMSFMFASDDFNTEMEKYDGQLLDNGGNPIDLDALRTKIRNHAGLVLGRVSGVGGLGGGSTYGLADYCYTGVYFDATPPDSHPHNYARQAMFHEYGHCLGYGHSSTMTYGDKWTVLCATVFVAMGKEGKLPVNSLHDVADLPM